MSRRFFPELLVCLAAACACRSSFAQYNGPVVYALTRRPVVPRQHEIDLNPRSKSAKLRAAVKL